MHFLWALLFKWFAFSPNLLHLIPSSAHIKLRTWLGFNSILDFVCAVKMSWISLINASFSFWALDLVIGPLGICKASFELFICAGAWSWLNCSSWFSSVTSSIVQESMIIRLNYRVNQFVMVTIIYGSHNHELANTLIGHPYASKLKLNEHFVLIDMTNNLMKPTNILLTLK